MTVLALWLHIITSFIISWLYIYVLIESFVLMTTLKSAQILYKNFVFEQSISRISLVRRNVTFQVFLFVLRFRNVKADQYVNFWISSIRFWQNHLYIIVFWNLTTVIFLVERKRRFFSALLSEILISEQDRGSQLVRRVFFTESHDFVTSMNFYDNVLMFANGYEIATHLFYIKKFIRDYNQCKIMTKRIHLI